MIQIGEDGDAVQGWDNCWWELPVEKQRSAKCRDSSSNYTRNGGMVDS